MSTTYQGWGPLWTGARAIPAEVENRIGHIGPAMHSKLSIEAANQCASLPTRLWGIRNATNEQWVDRIPSLRERKSEARRKQWKHIKEGATEHQERKG